MHSILRPVIPALLLALTGCSARSATAESTDTSAAGIEESINARAFDVDSAMSYIRRQTDFGPRVPNTEAHRKTAEWLASELQRHGAVVTETAFDAKAFDGTILHAVNIYGSYNPDLSDRLLLLAHWDTRPWADKDPDPSRRHLPVEGANDGASGVAVLLELARQFSINNPQRGIDILFVDAEDWGTDNDEDSWALGAKYFVDNPPAHGYPPKEAILLDMVGGKDATFCAEYFSLRSAPELLRRVWATAESLGHGSFFPMRHGGAVTDDHVKLIENGIPTIDIIDFRPDQESGFPPQWHTVADTYDQIDPATIRAVGETVSAFIYGRGQ